MKKTKKILIITSLLIVVIYVFRKAIGKGLIVTLAMFLYLFFPDPGKLAKGYFFFDDFEAMDIGYPYGSTVFKKKGHYIEKDIVSADIIRCEKKRGYIFVKQRFNDSLAKKRLFDSMEGGINYKMDSVEFFNGKTLYRKDLYRLIGYDTVILERDSKRLSYLADSIVYRDAFYQKRMLNPYNYYIINLKTDELFGPLSHELFKKKAKDIGISRLDDW